jgi:hypothetical protein
VTTTLSDEFGADAGAGGCCADAGGGCCAATVAVAVRAIATSVPVFHIWLIIETSSHG